MSLKETIKDFLEDEESLFVRLPILPLSQIVDELETYGYEQSESNDWQVDFWLTLSNIDNVDLTLTVSLWYGYYTLTKEE